MDAGFYYNFSKICRICLHEGNNMVNIFDSLVVSEDILSILSGLQISRDNELPSQICIPCFTVLTLFSNFKTKCETSNLTLRNYLLKIKDPNKKKEANLYHIDDLEKSFAPITDYISQPFDLDGGSSFIKFVSNDACDQNINVDFFKPISDEPAGIYSNSEEIFSKYQNISGVKDNISDENKKNPEKTNVCCICNIGVADYDSLRKHMDIHLEPTNHCCTKCSCYFTTGLQLQRHNERLHPENSTNDGEVFYSNHTYKTERETEMDKVELLSDFDFLDEPEIKLSNEMAFGEKIPDEDISTFNITNMTNFSEDSRLNGFIGDLINENLAKFECANSPDSNFEPFNNSMETSKTKYNKKYKKKRKKHIFETYKCHICPVVYKKYPNFREHMNAAHDLDTAIKPFMCANCSKGFSRRQNLVQHLETYKFKECIEKFTKSADLTVHKKVENLSKDFSLLCPECGKTFVSIRMVHNHHQKEHQREPIVCVICKLTFSSINNLNLHMKTHRIETLPRAKSKKLIICTSCGKSCHGKSNWKVHMRRHTGQMTCICKVCGQGYPRMTDLTIHMRRHTGERPFECKICSKRFVRSDSLSVHMRVHTGEKPFACECGEKFSQKSTLVYHKKFTLKPCITKWNSPLTSTPLHEPTSDVLLNFDKPTPIKTRNNNKTSAVAVQKISTYS